MTIKYLFFTSSRADLGLLSNLYLHLQKTKNIETHLAVNGVHLSKELGYTFSEIENLKMRNIHKLNYKYDFKIENDPNKIVSSVILDINKLINKINPDFLIVVGDRYETLAATISAYLNMIQIIHFHGGEKTIGSFDDSIRHAITKLSNHHFVAEKDYYKRVVQLGENKSNIYLIGNLFGYGIDKIKFFNKKSIENKLNIKFNKYNLLITIHPETNKKNNFIKKVKILLDSLSMLPKNYNLYFTSANTDPGGSAINKLIQKFVRNSENRFYFESLGQIMYLSFLQQCDIVVGNSSSAVIEAPYFNIASLNIGDRQIGRVFRESVFHCDFKKNEILKNIEFIINNESRRVVQKKKKMYDINRLVTQLIKINKKQLNKEFIDLV